MPRRLQPSNFLKVEITEREEWENGVAPGVVRLVDFIKSTGLL